MLVSGIPVERHDMAVDHHARSESPRTPGLAGWLVGAPAVLVALGLGLWFLGGVLPVGYATSIVLSALWFVAMAAVVWVVARRVPALGRALTTTFVAATVASGFGFYWTSIRDDRVNETVVTGVAPPPASPAAPAGSPEPVAQNVETARGVFTGRAHPGRGNAAIVALAAGGTKLTFTDFATDNGPDLRVYLVKGPVNGDGDVKDPVDLGRLKGNIGNQQYTVPEGVDPAGYTVVIWCRAFSVAFTQAELKAV